MTIKSFYTENDSTIWLVAFVVIAAIFLYAIAQSAPPPMPNYIPSDARESFHGSAYGAEVQEWIDAKGEHHIVVRG